MEHQLWEEGRSRPPVAGRPHLVAARRNVPQHHGAAP